MAALGLDVREVDGILTVDGARVALNLVARAHPTPADLRQLVEDATGHLPALVVADRISEPGREELRQAGWGWLDRRGHVRVWTPGVRIESPVGHGAGPRRPRIANPWTTVGLEVALAALIAPGEQVTARRVAPGSVAASAPPTRSSPGSRRWAWWGRSRSSRCSPSCSGRRRRTGPTTAGSRSPSGWRSWPSPSGPTSSSAWTSGRPRWAAHGSPPSATSRRVATCRRPGRCDGRVRLVDRERADAVLGAAGARGVAARERRAPARCCPPLAGRPPDRVRAAPGPRSGPRQGDRRRVGHRARRWRRDGRPVGPARRQHPSRGRHAGLAAARAAADRRPGRHVPGRHAASHHRRRRRRGPRPPERARGPRPAGAAVAGRGAVPVRGRRRPRRDRHRRHDHRRAARRAGRRRPPADRPRAQRRRALLGPRLVHHASTSPPSTTRRATCSPGPTTASSRRRRGSWP